MGVKLKVWGEYACFTRPEMKAERVSYDVMTPSAARGILEAILWKPAIRWEIDRIHVLREIRFQSLRRNELGDKISASNVKTAMNGGKPLSYCIEDDRQQRATLLLRDVAYVIEAHFVLTEKAGPQDNEGKFIEMFRRRAEKGQCFHRPCMGCREFPAQFELVEGEAPLGIDKTADLGWMLYDIDFSNHRDLQPRFFRAQMEHGMITVPPWQEVMT